MELLSNLERPVKLLDVGGTVDYWNDVGLVPNGGIEIALLNVFQQEVSAPFESLLGDARDLSRFADSQFDVVFSNSVLGQVGTFRDQLRMAQEVRRVGRQFFVQTPNQRFPIDWRTSVPLFHFLPPHGQAWFFERIRVGTYRRAESRAEALEWSSRVRDVKRHELSMLFPGAKVVTEYLFGFPKSFMVHNF
jgi:hypothetical protein